MTFEWPLVLLSLALVPRSSPPVSAGATPAPRVRHALHQPGAAEGGRRARAGLAAAYAAALFLLGLGALLVGLARPTAVIAIPRDQSDVMLVMDVSGSMAAAT